MQTELNFEQEDYIIEEGLEKKKSLGEQVRDISYSEIIMKEDTNVQRDIVYNAIQGHPEGVTDTEICILTDISKSSVNARRNELRRVVPVGVAIYTDEHGYCRLNTMWGIQEQYSKI